MTTLERLAQAMCRELGWEFDSLYESKREWVADRGARHDINTPRKPDALDAVRAILTALRDPDEGIVWAMREAHLDGNWSTDATVTWQAGIDHILAETTNTPSSESILCPRHLAQD